MTTHILTHFHTRRTGVTSHVEDIAQALQAMGRNAVVLGESLLPGVPTIERVDALALLNEGSPVTWHAHRPHSLKEGLKLSNAVRIFRGHRNIIAAP